VASENEFPSTHPFGVLLHTLTIAETSAEEVAGPLDTVLPSAQPASQIAKHATASKPVRLSSRFVSLDLILSRSFIKLQKGMLYAYDRWSFGLYVVM
jgi:hypothetical protein